MIRTLHLAGLTRGEVIYALDSAVSICSWYIRSSDTYRRNGVEAQISSDEVSHIANILLAISNDLSDPVSKK